MLQSLVKLVGLGDVAHNAGTEVPPGFNIGHSSDCQLEVYGKPTTILALWCCPVLFRGVKPASEGQPRICNAISPTSSSSEPSGKPNSL